MSIALPGLMSTQLGLEEVNISSLMEVRRFTPAFENAVDKFERVADMIDAKRGILQLKKSSAEAMDELDAQREALSNSTGSLERI